MRPGEGGPPGENAPAERPGDVSSWSSEPPVMWPGADSGFEADPNSPAGVLQNEAAFARGITRFRFGKLIVWFLIVVLIVAPVTIGIVSLIRSR